MKRSLLLALLATLPIGLALAAQPAGAQMREPASAQGREPGIALGREFGIAQGREPYGIGLEGFAYPYPVQMLPLVNDGEQVRMAYMDVQPAA
ncbi:MAG: alpha/beta hydrolase, partial [Tardiphaga sp.]|nr:alpha/beta hydrolase [Tardiphaga sp.]